MAEYVVQTLRTDAAGSSKKEQFFVGLSRKCLIDYYGRHDREAVLCVMAEDVAWFGPLAHLHGTGVNSLRAQFEASPEPLVNIVQERWNARPLGTAWLVVGMAKLEMKSTVESDSVFCVQNVTFVWEKRGRGHRITHVHISTAHSSATKDHFGDPLREIAQEKANGSVHPQPASAKRATSEITTSPHAVAKTASSEIVEPQLAAATNAAALTTVLAAASSASVSTAGAVESRTPIDARFSAWTRSLLAEEETLNSAFAHPVQASSVSYGSVSMGQELSAYKKLWLKRGEGDYYQITENAVIAIEASAHRCQVVCAEGTFDAKESISIIKENLSARFVRIHRSFIVNVDHVVRYGRFFVQMDNGRRYPVPEKRYTAIRTEFENKLLQS